MSLVVGLRVFQSLASHGLLEDPMEIQSGVRIIMAGPPLRSSIRARSLHSKDSRFQRIQGFGRDKALYLLRKTRRLPTNGAPGPTNGAETPTNGAPVPTFWARLPTNGAVPRLPTYAIDVRQVSGLRA